MSSEVDDGVLLEHDRVVAGRQVDRPGRPAGLLGRLAADRRRVDRRRVDRGHLRVPGPVVRAHRDRRAAVRPSGPRRRGSPPSSRPRPSPRRWRTSRTPSTPAASAAAMTARTPAARSSGEASAVPAAKAPPTGVGGRRRPGARPSRRVSSTTAAIRPAVSAERPEPVGVGPAGRGDADALAADERGGSPGRRFRRRSGGSRSWRSGSAPSSPPATSDLGLRRARRLGQPQDRLGQGEGRGRLGAGRLDRVTASPPPGRRGTGRPSRRGRRGPTCIGSPLPQFGVPSIT